MKQWLAALVVGGFAAFAHADGCRLTSAMDVDTRKVFRAHGSWQINSDAEGANFDRKCALLHKHGMAIQVNANAAVLTNVSIGVASVMVKDAQHNIYTADYANYHTFTNTFASQDKANEIMAQAIVQAFLQWPDEKLQAAIAALNTTRREIRQAYKK